jgi:hypothetical protein
MRETGFTTGGDFAPLSPFATPASVLIVIEPARVDFGVTPEASREGAPKMIRNTVSTKAEELDDMFQKVPKGSAMPLLRRPSVVEDTGGGGYYAEGYNIPSGRNYATCQTTPGAEGDADSDGLLDQCEYELAYAFRPQLASSYADCNMGRETYWAAKNRGDGYATISVFYALSYYVDCGMQVVWCYGCESHTGDSEFIMLELEPSPYYPAGSWRVRNATLSSHWHSQYDATATYAGPDLQYGNESYLGRPVVWVAEGKHGNYRSSAVCDAGALYTDNCDRNSIGPAVEVLPWRNLGRLGAPLVLGAVGSVNGQPGLEDFWYGQIFNGWQGNISGGGSTGYGTILTWANYN